MTVDAVVITVGSLLPLSALWLAALKGIVSQDILILFKMSIVKSVLFAWSLIPLRFFYCCLILYLFPMF
jgi:hypothetical protein